MDILLFSDIHIHPHKSSHKRLEDCLKALRWVFQTARDENIKSVIFCGDLFQNRLKIDTLTYYLTFEIFNEFKDVDIVLLEGNHDLWFHDRTDVSSVKPLSALPHVRVVDKPSTLKVADTNIDFIPFTHNPLKIINDFKLKSRILCGHLAVDNAQLNKLYDTRAEVSVEMEKDMVIVDVSVFDGWEKVFLGHYHGEQKLNERVEYLGSTLQLSFGEAFQKKHIAVLDTKTLKTKYIENTFSPKHLIIPFADMDKYDLANNFVQIQVDDINAIDILDTRKEILESKEVQTLEFKPVKTKTPKEQINLQEKFDLAKGDILDRWVQSVDIGLLEKDYLLQLGKEICQSEN